MQNALTTSLPQNWEKNFEQLKIKQKFKFHLKNAEKQISLPEGVARGFILTVRI